jgi:hypothetical protein
MAYSNSLNKIFKSLKKKSIYKGWVKIRIAKIILGSSVIRVFVKGSKTTLLTCLSTMDLKPLQKIQTQKEFDNWHLRQVDIIYRLLKNKKNVKRLSTDGLKWGHSSKVINLFIGHLVFYSSYFNASKRLEKLKFFLHVPLDKKVFDALRLCNIPHVPSSIKLLTKKIYYELQHVIYEEAHKNKLPALYFDEYAWAFDKED